MRHPARVAHRDLDYGETVLVGPSAPTKYRPGSRASVVGLPTETRNLVVIEFEDGTSIEVPPETLVRAAID